LSLVAPSRLIRPQEFGLELRKAGNSYQEIAGERGLKAKSRAYEFVMEGLGDLETMSKETAAELRRVELERLDAVHLSPWEQRGDPRVADTLVATVEISSFQRMTKHTPRLKPRPASKRREETAEKASLPLVDHLAVEAGHVNLRLLDGFRRDGEDVIGEDNEQTPWYKRARPGRQ
jgi:hypothetical protein